MELEVGSCPLIGCYQITIALWTSLFVQISPQGLIMMVMIALSFTEHLLCPRHRDKHLTYIAYMQSYSLAQHLTQSVMHTVILGSRHCY